MSDTVYHFSGCELRTGTRELFVAGRLQALEPLAFDLLAYLLRHHDRAVSKDELLDEVWLGRIVTVGTVARAAWLVRKVLEGAAGEPLLRTVHSVGYRFVGAVDERVASVPRAAPAAGPPVVALLPFENLTGDASLDWVTIGLMALVRHALAADPRLAPLTMHDVAAALQGLAAGAPVQVRVDALRRFGAQQVLHSCITREDQAYRLDYRLLAPSGEAAGTVYAHDLIRLGRALARRLLGDLLPGMPAGNDAFTLHDPWAMQLLARAMQAREEQAWRRALLMLRVVIDLEPDYEEARQELGRVEAVR